MQFKNFIGKTILDIDETSVNCIGVIFTDGTCKNIFAEPVNNIPELYVEKADSISMHVVNIFNFSKDFDRIMTIAKSIGNITTESTIYRTVEFKDRSKICINKKKRFIIEDF